MPALLERVALVTRGIVHAGWRRRGLFSRLLREAERHCRAIDRPVSDGIIATANRPARALFDREGWFEYHAHADVGDWSGVAVAKRL